MAIDTILCDMGGVLIEWNPQKLIAEHVSDIRDQQLIYQQIFEPDFWTQSDRGLITDEQKIEQMRHRLPGRLHRQAQSIMTWPDHVAINYHVFDHMTDLKRNYRLILLSNVGNFFDKIAQRVPRFNLFEDKVLSYQEGVIKPDPAIYLLTLARYKLRAEQCLFIDDNICNTQAAAALGIRTVHFTGDTTAISQALKDCESCQASRTTFVKK